jgi:hypothetical protein
MKLKEWILEQNLPKDVIIKFAGADEEREESAAFLGNAMNRGIVFYVHNFVNPVLTVFNKRL